MSNALIYAGIAVGIAAVAGIFVFGTQNQQTIFPTDSPPQSATQEGKIIPSDSGLAPTINKEQWHEDPFADEAAEVKAKLGL